MWKWLFPKDVNFFDYFLRHAKVMQAAAREFSEMLTTGQNLSEKAKHIKDLEHEADGIAHECIEKLHKTFITPFQRDDIHRLISKLDDIIDYIEDGSARVVIYRLTEITPQAKELAHILEKAIDEINTILLILKGKSTQIQQSDLFHGVHSLENEADRLYLNAIGKLFDEVDDVKMIIKWKEIYENLEDAIDCCEEVVHIIEGVLLESR